MVKFLLVFSIGTHIYSHTPLGMDVPEPVIHAVCAGIANKMGNKYLVNYHIEESSKSLNLALIGSYSRDAEDLINLKLQDIDKEEIAVTLWSFYRDVCDYVKPDGIYL